MSGGEERGSVGHRGGRWDAQGLTDGADGRIPEGFTEGRGGELWRPT